MSFQSETLMELIKVTEWRDGCVYKTVPLGVHWIPDHLVSDIHILTNKAKKLGGDFFVSPSYSKYPTFNDRYRTIKVNG